jgi:hypothetical protein
MGSGSGIFGQDLTRAAARWRIKERVSDHSGRLTRGAAKEGGKGSGRWQDAQGAELGHDTME